MIFLYSLMVWPCFLIVSSLLFFEDLHFGLQLLPISQCHMPAFRLAIRFHSRSRSERLNDARRASMKSLCIASKFSWPVPWHGWQIESAWRNFPSPPHSGHSIVRSMSSFYLSFGGRGGIWTPGPVDALGFEPRAVRLRVYCSTIGAIRPCAASQDICSIQTV